MSEWDQFDNRNNENEEGNSLSGSYQSENSSDIYNTPDITRDTFTDVTTGETSAAEVVVEGTPVEETAESAPAPYNYNPYSYDRLTDNQNNGNPYDSQVQNDGRGTLHDNYPYGNRPYTVNQDIGNPYNNGQYNNAPYENNQYGGNPYNNSNQNGGVPYNNNQYGGAPYNNGQYGNAPYNDGQYGAAPYNNGQYGGAPYNNNQNGGTPYNNGQYGGNFHNNNQNSGNPYNNNGYNNPYGGQVPPNNNQYSPYAVPPQKNKNGLILGIVIAVIVLFLIAIFALAFRAMELFSEDRNSTRSSRSEYNFDYDDDDGWGVKPKQKDEDNDDDYDYDDWDYDDWYDDYDDDYDEDSEYYELHDDIRWDLSYSVKFDTYEDAGDIHENAYIAILYPVIVGDDVPNLDRLNDVIQDEIDFLISLADDLEEDVWADVDAEAYVTYMDEDRLSIVFHENMYVSDDDGYYEEAYYLWSLNIDMKNGVVLDNENLIDINDDFSVDFRQRSDIQNGEISYLTMMTDQEITGHFKSSDIIVFYTPMGLEIGFNYDQGWVTVTYEDYEQYLKVF